MRKRLTPWFESCTISSPDQFHLLKEWNRNLVLPSNAYSTCSRQSPSGCSLSQPALDWMESQVAVAAQYFPQESSMLALHADSPFRTVPAVPSPVPLLEAIPRLEHWGSRKGWRLEWRQRTDQAAPRSLPPRSCPSMGSPLVDWDWQKGGTLVGVWLKWQECSHAESQSGLTTNSIFSSWLFIVIQDQCKSVISYQHTIKFCVVFIVSRDLCS